MTVHALKTDLRNRSPRSPSLPPRLAIALPLALVVAFAPPCAHAQGVTWTSIVNATPTGNSLEKTAGCDGCDDSGAVSVQSIASGDGHLELTASETTTQRSIGLSRGNTNTTLADIDFALQFWPAGGVDVRESGLYRNAETTYVPGDVFRIAVESGVVKYYKNGGLIYSSGVGPTYPLLVDTSLYNVNATFSNVLLSSSEAAAGPELPREFLNTTYVEPSGTLCTVNAGDNFQAALNSPNATYPQPCVIIELQAGATFTGNFTLPNRPVGAGWIHIRSSSHEFLPSPGTRISCPETNLCAVEDCPVADLMPKIVTANSAPAISAGSGSHHYRFVGVEITVASPPPALVHNLIWLENVVDGPSGEAHIVFDRSYIHGTPGAAVTRGILLNGKRTAVIDSRLSDIHVVGQDTQAIGGVSGPGPFKIINNYLEGAGENVIFGGGDPPPGSLIVPADIEIRENHFFKPLCWKQNDPSYAGTPWTVKNIFELKNARRVLVEGNVLENCWADGQGGTAVLFTVRNQDGGCPWCVVEDVTFENNIVRHATSAFGITGTDNNFASGQAARIAVRNNLLYDLDPAHFGLPEGQCFRIFQLLTVDSPNPAQPGGIKDLTIDHNTGRIVGACTGTMYIGGSTAADDKHVAPSFTNNLLQRGTYGVFGGPAEGTATLDAGSTGWTFTKNAIIGAPASSYPPNNFFPATDADVKFVNVPNDDYRLCEAGISGCVAPYSPYNNAGTDGKDLGADVAALMTMCAAVGASDCP